MFTSQATNWTLTRTETCFKSMCQESPIDKRRKLTIYPIWISTTRNGISRDSATLFSQRALGTTKSRAATGYVRNNILLNQTQLQKLTDAPYSNAALHKQMDFPYFIWNTKAEKNPALDISTRIRNKQLLAAKRFIPYCKKFQQSTVLKNIVC
jgi:hypothetical protein